MRKTLFEKILPLTWQHIYLVSISLLFSILIGVPLGILAAKYRTVGQVTLVLIGLFQTIPALALLCFLIPVFGIGTLPSLIALFLYALLPIVNGTYVGFHSLDRRLLETGVLLGLNTRQRLFKIELPLASLSLLNGVKTSAVIAVGTATLAALIGAGGLGTLIVTGLALNDLNTVMMGAIPAAVLALWVHGLFEWIDRLLVPKGLKLKSSQI